MFICEIILKILFIYENIVKILFIINIFLKEDLYYSYVYRLQKENIKIRKEEKRVAWSKVEIVLIDINYFNPVS